MMLGRQFTDRRAGVHHYIDVKGIDEILESFNFVGYSDMCIYFEELKFLSPLRIIGPDHYRPGLNAVTNLSQTMILSNTKEIIQKS